MRDLEPGMIVRSKAGRDKGCIYVVIDVKNEYVYAADGGGRPLGRTKRKNRKHLQPVLKAGIADIRSDEAIRTFIRKYAPDSRGSVDADTSGI